MGRSFNRSCAISCQSFVLGTARLAETTKETEARIKMTTQQIADGIFLKERRQREDWEQRNKMIRFNGGTGDGIENVGTADGSL
ncbi:hypothetical protein KP509_24G011500 [Ceratopteris richardii]|uniref:Uncharacterized protein n=1 Tax=Ceratopteris richardii TaxID=49495 RepID=A0A8T2RSH9_CERRI|nr:hypothetical protein KP509_24G011500 [Ceratopteris richardii]